MTDAQPTPKKAETALAPVTRFLAKFRTRLIALIVLFVALTVAFYILSPAMIADLAGMLAGIASLYQSVVGEALFSRLVISAVAALVPVAFAALTMLLSAAKKPALGYPLLSLSLALLGAAFARYVLLPPAITLLSLILAEGYELHITLYSYVTFCVGFMAVLALLFQLPVASLVLYRLGLVDAAKLKKWRKRAFFITLVILAVLTPSQDAATLALAMLPFVALYEASVLWLRILENGKKSDAG